MAISLSPIEELATKAVSYARPTISVIFVTRPACKALGYREYSCNSLEYTKDAVKSLGNTGLKTL